MSTRGSAAPSLAAPAGHHRRARPSRWRTGTLAAAGTIPVRSVNAHAILVRGTILRTADLRSRHAYMRVAVAAAATPPRYATPTRRARRRGPGEHPAHALTAHYRLPGTRVKGACGVAARALRAPDPAPLARSGSYQG